MASGPAAAYRNGRHDPWNFVIHDMNLTGNDRAMIYGAMIWIAEKLSSEDGEHARGIWTKLGEMAFEMDIPAGPNDRVQPQPDRA